MLNDFRSLGYNVIGEIIVSTDALDSETTKWLQNNYNFPTDQSFEKSLYEYLNIDGEGKFYLATKLNSDLSKDEYTQELFYNYDGNNNNNFTSGDEFTFKKIETTFNPQPTQRGKNKYANTFEDQNNLVRRGYWRSVSHYVDGDKDAEDFSLAVEDCIKTVPHGVICDIVDVKTNQSSVPPIVVNGPPGEGEGEVEGEGEGEFLSSIRTLKKQIEEEGKVIIFVKKPRYTISIIRGGSEKNPNDIPDVYDYEDPNNIPEPQPSRDKPEIRDPCEDIVPNLMNSNLNLEINDGTINGPQLTSGLEDSMGLSYKISCNGKNINVVMPSKSRLKVVRTTKAEYFAARRTGVAGAINKWSFAGDISSQYGLSHNVIVTDITPNENEPETEFTVPASIGGRGGIKFLKTAQAECDGFFLPIVPGLESLSATLDSRGLRVSYSYKEIPEQPKPIRGVNSIKRSNTSVTLS